MVVVLRARVGDRGVGEREPRIERHGVLEHLERELQVLSRQPAGVALAAQIQVVRLEVLGRLGRERLLLLRRQRDAQRLGDLARDLVLQLEDVLHLAVVALGPDREIRLRVDQLRVDAQPRARAAQAAGEHVRAPSCWPICAGVTGLSRYASTVGRENIFKPLIFESSVMMSSVMPSRKYSSSFTPLRFSKYSTAIDCSAALAGCATRPLAAGAPAAAGVEVALEPHQVGLEFRRRLIAQVAILLERLVRECGRVRRAAAD